MLSHDMRSPLNAVLMTAQFIAASNAGAEMSEAAATIINSGAAMKALLDDLLDFNHSKPGFGINVQPAEVDLAQIAEVEIDLQCHAHPGRRIELHVEVNLCGCWDGARLQQVLRNLLANAIQHGANGKPITLTLRADKPAVHLEVKTRVRRSPQTPTKKYSIPVRRGPTHDGNERYSASLGLGLYIVREVVKAHGGNVEVRSVLGETVFSVHLPRTAGGA